MSYTVDAAEGLKRSISITIPTATIDKEVNKNLLKLQNDKSFKLQGFRPGHIPLEVIRQHRGNEALQRAIQKLVDAELDTYAKESKEIIAILNNIDYPKSEDGIVAIINLEVYPQIPAIDYTQITVKQPVIDVDRSIDEMIEVLREQRATFVKVDRESQEGDVIITDFAGYIDGEAFENGSSNDYRVQLGKGQMIPEFEAALLGKKAGDEFEAPVKFPEDYHAENLKGKDTVFKFKVHAVEEKVLPEVNPKFISAFFEKGDNSIDRLRNEVRKNIEREIKLNTIRYIQPQIDKQLLEQFKDVEYSSSLIETKAKELRLQQVENYAKQFNGIKGFDANSVAESIPLDEFITLARNNEVLSQVYKKIASDIELQVYQQELNDYIDEISIMFEHPVGYKEEIKKDTKQLQNYTSIIANSKLVKYIIDQVNVQDEPIKYQELVQATSQGQR